MPQKLTFSKVSVLSFSRKPDSGTARLSCAPTKTVLKAMGWEELPEWQKAGTPMGELNSSIVEITPSASDLAKHAIELNPAVSVGNFEFVRVKVTKGKKANKAPSYRLELHCEVNFADANGARKLEAFMQSVNNGDCSMRVTYEPPAEQTEIPLQDETRRQATGPESDVVN